MSWIITGTQQYPAVIGESFGGGYFAGYISHTADGNATHALIVAPRATGATGTGYTLTTNLVWKTSNTSTANTNSLFDGAANTAAMVAANIDDHPAAKFCTQLAIGGFTDWYLPSKAELEIAYFNLKPSTLVNQTATNYALNPYAVPAGRVNYSSVVPSQTAVNTFKSGGLEAFVDSRHWSSRQATASVAEELWFNNGFTAAQPKSLNQGIRVRAFRRIAL